MRCPSCHTDSFSITIASVTSATNPSKPAAHSAPPCCAGAMLSRRSQEVPRDPGDTALTAQEATSGPAGRPLIARRNRASAVGDVLETRFQAPTNDGYASRLKRCRPSLGSPVIPAAVERSKLQQMEISAYAQKARVPSVRASPRGLALPETSRSAWKSRGPAAWSALYRLWPSSLLAHGHRNASTPLL